jgi:hypothetical protein
MLRRFATAGLLAAIAGCAKQEAKVDSTATAVAPTPNVVTITTKDFAFTAPDTIPAGMTTLVLQNQGATIHHVQLLRLKDGKTLADLQEGLKHMKPTDPPPPWVEDAGGVNTPMPGAESRATLLIEPGDYAMICFIDTPDKVPHMMKGMIKGLTVTGPAAAAYELPSDVTLTLSDYTFAFSTPLTSGQHVVKIVNTAAQSHEFVVFKLAEGKTMDDLGKWAATYKGDPPGALLGGTPAMRNGQTEFVPLDLTPGNYVALCFVPDAKDGKPHLDHGMVYPFTIS